jgi:minor extracellular protease Epr
MARNPWGVARILLFGAALATSPAPSLAAGEDPWSGDWGDFSDFFDGDDNDPSDFAGDFDTDFEPDELLALNLSRAGVAAARRLGFRFVEQRPLRTLGLVLYRLRPPRHMLARKALALLRDADPKGFYDVNPVYRLAGAAGASAAADACEGVRCYGQRMIGWQQAGCPVRARIGVLDTAVDRDHPALAGRRVVTHRVQPGAARPAEREHGTAVAALLVGAATSSFPGLLPDAELVAADVFAQDNQGRLFTDAASLAKGLDWVAAQKPSVVNLSIVGPDGRVLHAAVQRMQKLGIAIVAAVGNEGPDAPAQYPAAYAGVIGVTAVDRQSRVYAGANQGAYVRLSAPGVSIWTAGADGAGVFREGTSFAAPFATAAVALLKMRQPDLTAASVLAALKVQARDLGAPGLDPVYGWGLLQSQPCSI